MATGKTVNLHDVSLGIRYTLGNSVGRCFTGKLMYPWRTVAQFGTKHEGDVLASLRQNRYK
jgi:hypothetical protein